MRVAEVDALADVKINNVETAAPPPTNDAPAPGWLVGLLWSVAAWALYYYILAV